MRRVSLLGLFALAQAGCSLTGLADFDIPACDDTQCEMLNERNRITDPCVRYHCAADGLCRLQPIDLDGDGHATAACAGSVGCGSTLECDDCDDTAAVAYPGQPEVCDGADNDCNLIVDDVASGGSTEAPVAVVTGTGNVTWHAYGAQLEGDVAPVAFGAGQAFFNVVEDDEVEAQSLGTLAGNVSSLGDNTMMAGCPTDRITVPAGPTTAVETGAGSCTSHADCDNGVLCDGYELCLASATSADAMGCTSGADNEEPCPGDQCNEHLGICELGNLGVTGGCGFADLDTAELRTGDWFGAMAVQTGCGNILRVGYFNTDAAMDPAMGVPGRNLLFRGTVQRSTSFRGIDRIDTTGGRCTGRSRADGEPLGAVLPSIAALPQNVANGRLRPQALVALLAPTESGGKPVEVIGVWNEQFSSVQWINATNDGIPQRLESAAVGDVRPVILAFDGNSASTTGYIVAYGVSGGGVAVRFVRPLADPVGPAPISNPPYPTNIPPGTTVQRTSDPITELGTEQILPTSGDATNVSLVIGRVGDDDSAQLGLAWRDADGVRFRILELDPEAGTFDDSAAVQSVASGDADEIALGYTPGAVVLPGFERGGATADADSSGGYLVAWRAGTTTSGARFAELDGEPIGDIARLGDGLRRMHVYTSTVSNDAGSQRSVPRLMYHDAPSQEFRVQAFCGPSS